MGTELPFDAESRQGGIVLSHTFRVDARSKHLLAAPLMIQNVEAWKSSHKDRKRVANTVHEPRWETGGTARLGRWRAVGFVQERPKATNRGRESRRQTNKQEITDT
jgi:hypothetical protein